MISGKHSKLQEKAKDLEAWLRAYVPLVDEHKKQMMMTMTNKWTYH